MHGSYRSLFDVGRELLFSIFVLIICSIFPFRSCLLFGQKFVGHPWVFFYYLDKVVVPEEDVWFLFVHLPQAAILFPILWELWYSKHSSSISLFSSWWRLESCTRVIPNIYNGLIFGVLFTKIFVRWTVKRFIHLLSLFVFVC